jgi:DNA-binding NarL/FixJ family response regulator
MDTATAPSPVVLLVLARERGIANALRGDRFAVIQIHTATLARELARDLRPDVIILETQLPDMSGLDACRLLRADLDVGHCVPILMLGREKPTPEERVTALRAGVWEFLPCPVDAKELPLALEAHIRAKRSIDTALAENALDPAGALHGRAVLARRARELGGLMARKHGGLACLVLATDAAATDPTIGSRVARALRISDVVGALSATGIAVLAPGTDHQGAAGLARRLVAVLGIANAGRTQLVPGTTLRVGYDAVANLKYSPIDPVDLLVRADAAVQAGVPEPGLPWLRRFEGAATVRPSGPTSLRAPGSPGDGPAERTTPV